MWLTLVLITFSIFILKVKILTIKFQKGLKRKSEVAAECSTPKKSAVEKVRGRPKAAAASGSRQGTPKLAAKGRQGTPQGVKGRGTPRVPASVQSPVNGKVVKSPQKLKSPSKVKSPVKSPAKGTSWIQYCSVS